MVVQQPLQPRPPSPPPTTADSSRPLTAWARKYGTFSKTDHQSGLTPTEYTFATLGPLNQPPVSKYEEYQKRNLYGFTTRELGQLDCLPTRELTPGNLSNTILPMLRRENWEKVPPQPDFFRDTLYTMPDGNEWSAHNDQVWAMLQPILVLASRMLMSVYVLPWFDALIRSPRKEIPPDRKKPQDQHRADIRYIKPRPTIEFSTPTATPVDRDRVFDVLQNKFKYQFGFMRTDEDPMDPSDDPTDALGLTATNHLYIRFDPAPNKTPRVFTWLNIHEFEYLLRDDLVSAERMCIEWSIANTVAHEVMHAVHFLFTELRGIYGSTEVYFDQEPLAEIGFSYEQVVNLGSTNRFINDKNGSLLPLGFFLSRYWPTALDVPSSDTTGIELIKPGVHMFDEMFPIPISFYQDVQQEEFWSVAVRAYGHKILHYRSLKQGSRVAQTLNSVTGKLKQHPAVRFSLADHTFPTLNNQFIGSFETLRTALSLTPEQRQAMEFGRAFLLSARTEQQFWDNTASQEALVQTAMTLMKNATQMADSDINRQFVFETLLNCMIDATSNHEVQIAAIQSLEAINNTTYPDRRAALKAWNRGTRVFIRNLKAADTINVIDVELPLLNLEICRMILYDPSDLTQQVTEEFIELQSIALARVCFDSGDLVQCRNLCLGVIGTTFSSIFAQCGAEAILFALDRDAFVGWDERKEGLRRMNLRMDYCMAGAPAGWKGHWSKLKAELVGPANGIARPVDPNAPILAPDLTQTPTPDTTPVGDDGSSNRVTDGGDVDMTTS